MAIYVGYARVSTQKQSLSRQVTNIRNLYPDIKIYSDKYTGTKLDRPNFQLLLSIVRPGDTIVFDSVSRMSRNAEEGYELYMELYEKGINLEFINEPHISSEYFRRASEQSIGSVGNEVADIYIRATNEVLMLLAKQQIKLAFEQADKEAADTRERIRQGLREREAKTGLKNGRKKGEKVIVHKKADRIRLIKKHSKDFYGSNTDVEVMKLLEPISNNTYYSYKREARMQFEAEQKAGINPFRFKLKTA